MFVKKNPHAFHGSINPFAILNDQESKANWKAILDYFSTNMAV